ncbi:MAG: PEGA domain-containing protein [Myxococcales bacterium]|jgi:hypothetical protein
MANRRSTALLARFYSVPGRAVSALTAFFFTLSSGAGVLSGIAHAGDLPRVVVLPYAPIFESLPAQAGEKMAEFLNTELRGSEQVQLVALDPKVFEAAPQQANPAPARDDAKLTEARERAAKADDFISKLKFKQAVEELEKVVALYESQHPYIDFGALVEVYLNLAVARFRLGQDEEGEALLAQVVRLDPERKLDAEQYPPVFIRVFENTAKKVKAAPRAAIRVDTTAQGATVVLDGREIGKAPVMIKDVIKGAHYLRVIPADGGEAWAERVEAAPGDVVRVTPSLQSAGGPIGAIVALMSRNVIDQVVVEKAAAVGEKAGAEFVVLGGVHKEANQIVVSSHLLRVAQRRVCLLQRVVVDEAMLGAGIEVYKVGADIGNKVEIFGEVEALPAKVARDALGSASVAEVTSTGDKLAGSTTGKPAIVRRGSEGATTIVVQDPPTEVRKITATGEPNLFGEPADPIKRPDTVSSKGAPTWLWVVLGVAVLGGAAGGGYFYYSQATKPITGAGPVSW